MKEADIGLIGLAVMGENLILNMAGKGFTVACYNRTVAKVDAFLASRAKGHDILGAHSLEELVALVKRPRKIMMMVKAGQAVDELIEKLVPLLQPGDIIIDGGNSHFPDTTRRTHYLESKGLLFVGAGVSGGEEGALNGPSLMPGGSFAAWPFIKDIFQSICAHMEDGTPCCDWVGPEGAGHFVKMVHNGIEYGDMQLVCETYHLMKSLGLSNQEMSRVFTEWNQGDLDSYLIEITSDILRYEDQDGHAVLDQILDVAGQKGTGKWTAMAALEAGMPLTLIGEAVFARCLSALKSERIQASEVLSAQTKPFAGELSQLLDDLRLALYASKIISYAQGYQLMMAVAKQHNWELNYGGIALMWRGGCIIRSRFLGKIKEAFTENPNLSNLLMDPFFTSVMERAQTSWRRVVITAIQTGIPMPCITSALAYFDGFRTKRLPQNLLQAQRDYFGAHTYERIDRPRGEHYHTNWTGNGGDTTANSYQA